MLRGWLIVIASWSALCGGLLLNQLLRHESADASHLMVHARDWGILYAGGLAGAALIWAVRRMRSRPIPTSRLLRPDRVNGLASFHVGAIQLTAEGLVGPMRRFIAWDEIKSVEVETIHVLDYLIVLGARQGVWTQAGFRVPTLRLGQKTEQVASLIAFYRNYPSERSRIGTLVGARMGVHFGLLNAALPTPAELRWQDTSQDGEADPVIWSALQQVSEAQRSFAILTADADRNYYVQATLGTRGELYLEAVSHANLRKQHRLTTQALDRLASFHWRLDRPGASNFGQSIALDSPAALDDAARLVRRTLEDVYGLPPHASAKVQLGPKGDGGRRPVETTAGNTLELLAIAPVLNDLSPSDLPRDRDTTAFFLVLPVMLSWAAGVLLWLLAGQAIQLVPMIASAIPAGVAVWIGASALHAIVNATPAKSVWRAVGGVGIALIVYVVPAAMALIIFDVL